VQYISCSAEASVGAVIKSNNFIKSGASAAGLRVTKACQISDNKFVDTQSDESITLFKSNSHTIVSNNNVAQYLFGGGGTAGNCILLDQRNYYNTIINNVLNGSATYAVYLFSNSSYNTIVGNTIVRSNLGSIKVQSSSNGNTIDNNVCTDVIDATDPFESGAATAAIRVRSDCSGNIIGPGNTFAALAGLQIVDQQTVSGNVPQQLKGPTFSAYQSVAQTLSSGVITVINFQTEEFDTDNAYDTSTSKFQPAVAGYYQINAQVSVAASPSSVNCRVLKNGFLWKGGPTASGATDYSGGVSTIVYLNGSTDYVEIAAIFSVGQNTEALAASTWFNGAFLRA
jgi:parallel beta-helix repeat protein